MSSKTYLFRIPFYLRVIAGVTVAAVFTLSSLSSTFAEKLDFDAGWTLYQQGLFVEAFDIWEPLANAGDAKAQFNLAVLYEQGRGIDVDYDKAAYWNNRAVNSEYPPALHNLALSLLAEKKNIEAIDYLRQAAENNFAFSQYTLGKIHQFGIGIPENPVLAFNILKWLLTPAW